MIKRWITEDFKFINHALGPKGQKTLLEQNQFYGKNTSKQRALVINKLIDMIITNKKAP